MLDITRPIHEHMLVYPGNPAVHIAAVRTAISTTSALTQITLGSHTGTHIDAPAHIHDGAAGTDHYALAQMNGPCEVIEVAPEDTAITDQHLPKTAASRVLIKTRNSLTDIDTFDENFVALTDAAAEEIIRRQIQLIGIDAPSIKRRGVKDRVHELLLDAGVIILEGLWLQNVAVGSYELICLPLAVDLDGAPVRAALRPAPI